MHDEKQHDAMGAIAGALGQRETRLQSGFELQVLKECLKNNRSTKGRKLLIFEAKARDLVKTGQNGLFAIPHLRCPPEKGSMLFSSNTIDTPFSEAPQVYTGLPGDSEWANLMQQ
jgi:hypothetical protein